MPAKMIVVGALPETYSGKFMRKLLQMMVGGIPLGDLGACKNADCIEPLQLAVKAAIAPAAHGQGVEAMLRTVGQVLQTLLALESAPPHEPLMTLGIDSLSSTHLVSELQQRTGLQLSPTLIFEHSTPMAVAQHLAELSSPPNRSYGLTIPGYSRAAEQPLQRLTIAGLAGRWPRGIHRSSSVDGLWEASLAGFDAVGEVPAQRWTIDPSKLGMSSVLHTMAVRYLATVDGAELFDAKHFGMSSVEAAAIDPQQRLLLEGGSQTFQTAGITRQDLQGSNTGVFLGISNADFNQMLVTSTSVYAAVGGAISVASGRLSFAWDLQGACKSIDTACSSSLIALHASALGLRATDCHPALALVVNLILLPQVSSSYARAGMLSPDGRCRTFDSQANGYVRSEGMGSLLLALDVTSEAQAYLSSCAVRQDGMSASLTAPNGSAQATLLRNALARSSCNVTCLQGIEAHGTGTPLGDPTEGVVFNQPRTQSKCHHSYHLPLACLHNAGPLSCPSQPLPLWCAWTCATQYVPWHKLLPLIEAKRACSVR